MINELASMTFGVEIEAIMAFHQDLLQWCLNEINSNSRIIKDIPLDVRRALSQVNARYSQRHPYYWGWGLTTPTTYNPLDPRQTIYKDCLERLGYRGYAGEILHLGNSVLQNEVHVHDSWSTAFQDYSVWHLTHDNSLVGEPIEGLERRLMHSWGRDIRGNIKNIRDWNSNPIELVSRILPFTGASFVEIETKLSRLRGADGDMHTAFINGSCGLHVHIGLPPPVNHVAGNPNPNRFDLKTLQHLAYILVMYEREISKLFPRSRREGSEASQDDLQTNLDNFIPEPTYDDDDIVSYASGEAGEAADVDPTPEPDVEPTGPECPTIPFSDVRRKIFPSNMTLPALIKLMCGKSRGRIVNFLPLTTTGTLEFRQHEGTLDGHEVMCWVRFVGGLLRLAKWSANKFGVGGSNEAGVWIPFNGDGYRTSEWHEGLEVEDLLVGMQEAKEGELGIWVQERKRMFEFEGEEGKEKEKETEGEEEEEEEEDD